MKKGELGKFGEDLVAKEIIKNGWKIIERNFWEKWGEIDIVAKDRNGCLVFIEVKTMRVADAESLLPEDQMTGFKILKTQRMAEAYANAHPESVSANTGWRIDCFAVKVFPNKTEIAHYENI